MSFSDDVQPNNAEKSPRGRDEDDPEDEDPEQVKTQGTFKRLRSILDKLTRRTFRELMKQVMDLTINTEERLKGAVDLIFEKAISEPDASEVYANMCRCLMGLKVPTSDKPGVSVNFRKLLLNRCQKEFEKDQDDDEIFEKKQKEIEAAKEEEERERLRVELQESRDKARRRSLGNIKFIGELFKLKMLTEVIIHECIVRLLKNHDEESLECLCMLLSTIGKDLDFEKAKPRMDQYFNQMDKIIKEGKTSSRVCLMLQDVLRKPLEPRRSRQGRRKEPTGSCGVEEPEDDGCEQDKTQEMFRRLYSILNRITPQTFAKLMKQVTDLTIDTEERLKGAVDLIFEKAISEPDASVVYANMCRCLMGLKVPTSDKPEVFLNFRKLLLNRCQKEFEKDQDDDEIFEKKQKEIDAAKEEEERERLRVELQESRDNAHRRSLGNIKFIGELFKLKMLTEVIMHDCIVKLLKNHDEESLECLCIVLSTIGKDLDFEKAKPRMDQYFNMMDKIIKERKTSFKTVFMLQDVLDLRKNNWVPHRGDWGPKTRRDCGPETRRDWGPKTRGDWGPKTRGDWGPKTRGDWGPKTRGDCGPKTINQTHKGPESPLVTKDEDINKFATEQKVEFTTGEEMESKEVDKKKVLSGEELSKQLDRLFQDKANNQRIRDWVEANLDEQQVASNQFIRALMTSVCQSAIICDNPYRVDARQLSQRASLLQRYLSDEQKELQALYALQALMVHMEQPANLLRMFFDFLYDEDVIKEEAFYKWETSKDPAEQKGKGVALKSVTAFFTWLREAEEESDKE